VLALKMIRLPRLHISTSPRSILSLRINVLLTERLNEFALANFAMLV
jgi:hypothetical protein